MNNELIFGIHAVTALLETKPECIAEIYVQQGRRDQRAQQIIDKTNAQRVSWRELSRKELDELVPGQQHQGIIARCHKVVQLVEADIEGILAALTEPAFLLILDEVQDPHNLGACLRTANAAKIHLVIAPKDNSASITPTVRKVACGAAEVTPFIQVTNLARTIRWLKEQGIWIYGASDAAQNSLFQTDLRGPIALVLGAEGKGMRRLTQELCDHLVSIPMLGTVESLNVSVATGICLFEAVRQRSS